MSNLNQIKTSQLLLGDLLLVVMIGILAFFFFCLITLLTLLFPFNWWTGPLLVCSALYFSLCLLALLIPKVAPGTYELNDPKVRLWFLGFVFGRIWHFPLILYPIFNSLLLRTLFLRCLGCKAPLNSAISSDLSIYDPHLVKIGGNVVIGMKSLIVPHYIVHGKLYLGEVIIGEGSLVGAGAEIVAGAKIGKNVKINGRCTLMPDSVLPDGMTLKSFSIVSKADDFVENQKVEAYHRTKL